MKNVSRAEKALGHLDDTLGRPVVAGDDRAMAVRALDEVFTVHDAEWTRVCRLARIVERRTTLSELAKNSCKYCADDPSSPPPKEHGVRWHSIPAADGPAGTDWCKAWRIWDLLEEMPRPEEEIP